MSPPQQPETKPQPTRPDAADTGDAADLGVTTTVITTVDTRLPRAFWALWVGMLLNRAGGCVFPFLAVYLTRERNIPTQTVGVIMGLYAAGSFVAGPVGGALADGVGRRATLLGATVASAVIMMGLGFARSVSAIALLAPMLGFATDLCRAPLNAAVADLAAPGLRMRAYSLLYWAINLGFSVAAVSAGVVAERSYSLLFALDAASTLALAALVLVAVPETRPTVAGVRGVRVRDLLMPFTDRRFAIFAAIQLLILTVFAQVIVAVPLHMRAHGLSAGTIGRLLAVNGVVIVLMQPLAMKVAKRLRRSHVMAAGATLVGLGVGSNGLAQATGAYAVASVVWTIGEILLFTATPAVIADLSPVHRRGAYQGAYQGVWGLSAMIAPAIGAWCLARAGGAVLWLGCALFGVVAAALHLRWSAKS